MGAYLLLTTHAATPYADNQAENGTLGGSASVVSGSDASGGKYAQFGSGSSNVGVRTWPTAATTGANPATVTSTINEGGGWYYDSNTNDTIQNTEIDGAIYFEGTGTLTLRNDIIKPDWLKVFETIDPANNGSIILDHVTIAGVNAGQGTNFTKGFVGPAAPGTLDVGYSNITGICQNDVGTGNFNIHDNYIWGTATGNGNTCHGTPIEDEFGGSGTRLIEHNTLDEAPGTSTGPGATDGIFLQNTYGPISPDVIDDNAIHLFLYGIEVSTTGPNGVTAGPKVTNNCFVTAGPAGPLSDSGTVTIWSGNTQCDLSYKDTGIVVPKP